MNNPTPPHDPANPIVQNQAGMHKKQPEIVQSELEQELMDILLDFDIAIKLDEDTHAKKPQIKDDKWLGAQHDHHRQEHARYIMRIFTQREAQAYERGRRDELKALKISWSVTTGDSSLVAATKKSLQKELEKGKPE